MAIENKDLVKEYHTKLTDIKIRIPKADNVGIDYLSIMKERAKEKGFKNTKGKGALNGEGNVNAYILDLVSKDLIEAKKITEPINTSVRNKKD